MSDNTSVEKGIHRIKKIAQDVYGTLGSGFSEDVYDRAMQVGLRLAKIPTRARRWSSSNTRITTSARAIRIW